MQQRMSGKFRTIPCINIYNYLFFLRKEQCIKIYFLIFTFEFIDFIIDGHI